MIRSLGAPGDPKQWSQKRSGDIDPQYADIATIAQANKLRDVRGTTAQDIGHPKSGAKPNATDVKPGLNFTEKLPKGGLAETGGVDTTACPKARGCR